MQRSTAARPSPQGVRSAVTPVKLAIPQSAYFYPHRITFYDEAPSPDTELAIEDFERWALDRANVLDALDKMTLDRKNVADLEREMRPILNAKLPLTRSSAGAQQSAVAQNERFKDVMSHFILRLAACRSRDERERFVNLETRLFRLRYEMLSLEEQRLFVQDSNLPWHRASTEEVSQLAEECPSLYVPATAQSELVIFKVPMEEATELLRQRKVVVKQGLVYVSESQQVSMLAREFSKRLVQGLEVLARHRGKFKDDRRMDPVLDLMGGFSSSQYMSSAQAIDGNFTADSLDQLDRDNYLPLCSSVLHNNLKSTKHAFFDERRQYQTFLRNIGMPVDEAVRLYRRYYGNEGKMNEIEYSVQYTYGLKGSHKDHPPMSCEQIYKSGLSAQSNQAHGCPFQRLAPAKLEQLLRKHGIQEEADLQDVDHYVKMRRFDLACSKVYEFTHRDDKTIYDSSITSPNLYFERAWKHSKEKV